jgi:hypothetical protein
VQVLAGLPDDQRAALLAAQAEGAMNLDEVDEVRRCPVPCGLKFRGLGVNGLGIKVYSPK